MTIDRIRSDHPIRGAVASLSSGGYYSSIPQWWEKVTSLLRDNGTPPMRGDEPPQLYGVRGGWLLPLQGVVETHLRVSIYRMPGGGTYPIHLGGYEIICYLS